MKKKLIIELESDWLEKYTNTADNAQAESMGLYDELVDSVVEATPVSSDVIDELTRERDVLIRRARGRLVEIENNIANLREQMDLAIEGKPYYRLAGNTAMTHQGPFDVSVVNAAYDAIERVAVATAMQ